MASTKGTNQNYASNVLTDLSSQLFNIWKPSQQAAANTTKDLLTTGGSNATTPIIQQLIQSMRSGLSKTMVDTQGRMGMVRQAGTPFGQRILAETQRSGEADIASAGPEMAMKMLSMLLPTMTGGSSTASSGLGSAAGANAQVIGSQNDAYSRIMSSVIGSMGDAMKTVGGAAGACWIAEALYGPQAVETWLARWWITFQGPQWLYHLYRLIGRFIAQRTYLYRPLRPVFDLLVRHAQKEFSR